MMSAEANRIGPGGILPLQPEPIQTLVASFEDSDGTTCTAVVRRWTAAAAARCRLCRACSARVGPDSQAVCIVAIEGRISRASAALFSPDGIG
jgi:hypothetical protein